MEAMLFCCMWQHFATKKVWTWVKPSPSHLNVQTKAKKCLNVMTDTKPLTLLVSEKFHMSRRKNCIKGLDSG